MDTRTLWLESGWTVSTRHNFSFRMRRIHAYVTGIRENKTNKIHRMHYIMDGKTTRKRVCMCMLDSRPISTGYIINHSFCEKITAKKKTTLNSAKQRIRHDVRISCAHASFSVRTVDQAILAANIKIAITSFSLSQTHFDSSSLATAATPSPQILLANESIPDKQFKYHLIFGWSCASKTNR